ncbi:Tyrosinase [Smittium culicis]|uniref:Tyrosinase n=1 Tax=Smittium culicis TaxID=133412 RepID=A0A1R1X6Z3_9FUNG|nr:Tyrosinase [Smittium culicis]
MFFSSAIITISIFCYVKVTSQYPPNPTFYNYPCNSLNVRKEVNEMTNQEWSDFVATNIEMYRRGYLQGLANIHNDFAMEAHGSTIFLPFHRRFTMHYQVLMLSINPNVVIPYWVLLNLFVYAP